MKIPNSIRQLYIDQLALNNLLKEEVKRRMDSLRELRWHYESRVKSLQSFALKLETGRFNDPSHLEDFFACTLVVANSLEVDRAERLIIERFAVQTRRPGRVDWTHKHPDSFPFDDLRMYVNLGQDPDLPENPLANVIFEVQIKTFLQHAWSIATHDLIYKSDDANWSKQRIAYQIKAMLEHAEISIQEADRLAQSPSLAKEDGITSNIRKGIELIKAQWNTDDLPEDIRRLAENVVNLLAGVNVSINRLNALLNAEKERSGGALPINLSPYAVIVQTLLRHEKNKMQSALSSQSSKLKILISSEVEFPDDIARDTCRNGIFIG